MSRYLNGADSVGWLGPLAVGCVAIGLGYVGLGVLLAAVRSVIDRRRARAE